MHPEAHAYVQDKVNLLKALMPDGVDLVAELGSHDWNGTIRSLFDDWALNYIGLDIVEGPGVDIVGDASTHEFLARPDVIICTELLEHTPMAASIVHNVAHNLRTGGIFIATMAGPGRNPHAADGSGEPRPGEWYSNISPGSLELWLRDAEFSWWDVNFIPIPGDTRCWAVR